MGLISFIADPKDPQTVGGIRRSTQERKELAAASHAWNAKSPIYNAYFADFATRVVTKKRKAEPVEEQGSKERKVQEEPKKPEEPPKTPQEAPAPQEPSKPPQEAPVPPKNNDVIDLTDD